MFALIPALALVGLLMSLYSLYLLYAGLPEYEEVQKRTREGIPLHREVVEWFDSCAAELGLEKLRR